MNGAAVLVGIVLLAASLARGVIAAEAESWIADANGCRTWNPSPQPNETVTWSGGCRDGYLDGRGTLQWFQDGNLVSVNETTMIQGRSSGQSTYNNLKLRVSYEGSVLNGKAHGFGQVRSVETGQRYIGEFWEDKRHGLGILHFEDGTRYEGTLKENEWVGPVTISLPNGMRMIASVKSYKSGVPIGPGTQVFPDGIRVDTVFDDSGAGWLLGARCRQTWPDGDTLIGTVQIRTKDGLRVCTKSRGAKLADFLTEMASFGAAAGVAAYAIDNGITLAPGTDTFSALNQISQVQMARAAAMRNSPPPPPPPMPVASSPSADAQIAALQEQLRQQQQVLASMQAQQAGAPQGPSPQPQQQATRPPTAPAPRVVQQPSPRPAIQPAQEGPLPSDCVQHAAGRGLNDLQVNVANNCGETINVNICARVEGDIGTRTNARQMRAAATTQFSFFSPDKKPFQYQLRYCRPGGTTATNNCPAPCP